MGEEEVCQRVGPGQGLEGLAGAEERSQPLVMGKTSGAATPSGHWVVRAGDSTPPWMIDIPHLPRCGWQLLVLAGAIGRDKAV